MGGVLWLGFSSIRVLEQVVCRKMEVGKRSVAIKKRKK
jgi:hypothetical protein